MDSINLGGNDPNTLGNQIRVNHRANIRAFLVKHGELFTLKTVLDYGCGKQPYRNVVEEFGGFYRGYDRPGFPGSVVTENVGEDWDFNDDFDVIICTQVIQFVPYPADLFDTFRNALKAEGTLLLSYPTNWPVVEDDDLWRFTPAGINLLIEDSGFSKVEHESGTAFTMEDWSIPLENYVIATV